MRSLVFGIGSLVAVSVAVNYSISQRTQLSLDDVVTFSGWRISLKTPIGWSEGKPQTDLSGADVFVFHPISDKYGSTNAVLRVRRAQAEPQTTPRNYCNDVIAQFATIVGLKSFDDVTFAESEMGDWPACRASIDQQQDLFRDQLGLHVQILTAIDNRDAVPYAYSIDLQTAGPIRGREQATWDRIVESIRIVGG